MPTRRKVLASVARAAAGLAFLPFAQPRAHSSVLVNDIHSQLNPTRVDRIVAIDSEATLRAALAAARSEGKPVCIGGGRHAMGGQQFAEEAEKAMLRALATIFKAINCESAGVEDEWIGRAFWPRKMRRNDLLTVTMPSLRTNRRTDPRQFGAFRIPSGNLPVAHDYVVGLGGFEPPTRPL